MPGWKTLPWDFCSRFFSLPLCSTRCCSRSATFLEGVRGRTSTSAAGSSWEARDGKWEDCICFHTGQCPPSGGACGDRCPTLQPLQFLWHPLHSLLLLAVLRGKNCPPHRTSCTSPKERPPQLAVVVPSFSVTCIHSDLGLPRNPPPVPGAIRALPGQPLAVAPPPDVDPGREAGIKASCAVRAAAGQASQGTECGQTREAAGLARRRATGVAHWPRRRVL